MTQVKDDHLKHHFGHLKKKKKEQFTIFNNLVVNSSNLELRKTTCNESGSLYL